MLSICLVGHNQSLLSLVRTLLAQAASLPGQVEVLALDDGTDDLGILAGNARLNTAASADVLPLNTGLVAGVQHIVEPRRLGYSRSRQRLAETAKGNVLLFLDADAWPVNDELLDRYKTAVEGHPEVGVFVGGVSYRRGAERRCNPVRQLWGTREEELSAERRNKQPYAHMLTTNFVIRRSAMTGIALNAGLDRYGHENTALGEALQARGQQVLHLDNPVYHDDPDTSAEFLGKLRASLQSLSLHPERLREHSDALRDYHVCQRLHLTAPLRFLFRHCQELIERNLLGDKPSYALLRLYRIGYLSCVLAL